MKEWYGQHAINVLELQYPLSNHFLEYGVWTVQAVYRGYTYSKTFVVEEFSKSNNNKNLAIEHSHNAFMSWDSQMWITRYGITKSNT